ncbi:amidohydrolase family protein [Hwangdonia lutea]|uniref:Amidohydrolase family protein n=1 Tax=Hwangdonia lutea TaxID=3075823 RepID=A0AA97EMH8_9FLAO|nr:amidohydrolase family protein [Hwangdonia sp. SCSIO 19198]WOD44037.1 amidohydrolase family protein [Hwangdonia sp. SCSIO 19198]
MHYKHITVVFFLFVLCVASLKLKAQNQVAIVNANVVPMTSEIVLKAQTILISNGTITDINSSKSVKVPNGYRVIDAKGGYVLPGFINMYTHVNEANLMLYLANGQTTVRDIPSHINVLGLREQIKDGKVIGPRIIAYGLRATGAPAPYHSQQPIFNIDQAKAQVREAKRLGYDGMYVYATCLPETYKPILDEAKKIGLPISGHFPIFINENTVLKSKQPEFTNLTGITRGGKLVMDKAKLISLLKHCDKAVTPSLAVHKTWSLSHKKDSLYNSIYTQYIPPKLRATWKPDTIPNQSPSKYPYANVAQFVKDLSDNNIQLFLGSDGGYPLVVPGFAYLDEMKLFVEAGISNYKTLKYATVDAARFLKLSDVGTIEIDKRAELIVLGANPLKDISAIKTIEGVMHNHHWMDKDHLKNELLKLDKSINRVNDMFHDWKPKLKTNSKTTQLNYNFYSNDVLVGQQRILIDSLENNNISIRSVMVVDAPDYRHTYSCHRINGKTIDSLSIENKGSEGTTRVNAFKKQDSVLVLGQSPFHGKFSYKKFAPPNTQLWNPFISRYFELDNMVNYHLAYVLNKRLKLNEADMFKAIQIELNSEEYGEKYIVDQAMVTIIKTSEQDFRLIYPGFSGYANRTRLPFNVLIKTADAHKIKAVLLGDLKIVLVDN